jgi:ribosomal protein S27E
MSSIKNCEECGFELVKPKAKFMFTAVRKCPDCGNVERSENESVDHSGLPSPEKELLAK